MNKKNIGINVYSEIGKLQEVIVHRPGREIEFLDPDKLDQLLFANSLEPKSARLEHDNFVNILKNQNINVIELADLTAQTYDMASNKIKNEFLDRFLAEALPKLNPKNFKLIYQYLISFKNTRKMIDAMMGGITTTDLNIKGVPKLVVDPMPSLYFTRDPFASIGSGVTIHYMKYPIRRREVIFSEFILNHNSRFTNTPKYIVPTKNYDIEGGDIFVYDKDTLVIGISQRTKMEAIKLLAKNIKQNHKASFKKIYAINVPKLPHLMHLDTWLVMIDHDKFIYSPKILSELKCWEIDLSKNKLEIKELAGSLEKLLFKIINKKPILIPVAGENASKIDINIETTFDATNYLAISPGVVAGYSRNIKTEAALKKAGVKVLSFEGNQLSLGMGSARCMSMPIWRDNI